MSISKSIITDSDTARIADLVKIRMKKDELPNYTKQLNKVLESVSFMSKIDTRGIKPTAQTHGLTNIFREDTAEPSLNINDYPNRLNLRGRYFVVKKVI